MRATPIMLAAVMTWAIAITPAPVHSHEANNAPMRFSCAGNETATWTPGLTNQVQQYQIGISDQWSTCTVRGGDSLPYTATSQAQFPVTESCSKLGVPAEASWVIDWYENGTQVGQSTFQFQATVNVSRGNFVISAPGKITDGLYRGERAMLTITLPNAAGEFNNACDTTQGVTSLSGTSVLDIGGN